MDTREQGSSNFAYATLITRSSYLAGVIVLAHTLREHGSVYPLIVLYTSSLSGAALQALELEAARSELLFLHEVAPLNLPSDMPQAAIAERFHDTWTKLRVFEVYEVPSSAPCRLECRGASDAGGDSSRHDEKSVPLDLLCFLDADTMMCQNMDSVFQVALPEGDWIGACRDCICNVNRGPWVPTYCNSKNCPLTPLRQPYVGEQQMDRALRGSLEETGLSSELLAVEEKEKIRHFNSGVFLFRPSKELGMRILSAFNESPLLSTFKFPDQDFLRYFFQHRYLPLPWQYNAVKTSRTWHPDLWRDEEVICLHYIVDKPWTKVGQDGLAGCVGNDSVTYTLWWASFRRWRKETEVLGKAGQEILQIVNQFVDSDDETRSREVKRSGAGQ